MADPRHKLKEVKKRTVFDKLKGSWLFVLLMVFIMFVDVVAFIFWLSGILNGTLATFRAMITHEGFYVWVGLTAILAVFFAFAWVVQRRVHGARA